MKYRVSYDTILDPLSRVYTSNANLRRIPSYADHFAHLGLIFPVTNADLRGRDRADAECKDSYNTRRHTRRDLCRSINAIMRVSAQIRLRSSVCVLRRTEYKAGFTPHCVRY